MNILVILIPTSLLLGLLGLVAFLWTIRSHQYDDPDGQAARILLEYGADDPDPKRAATSTRGPATEKAFGKDADT